MQLPKFDVAILGAGISGLVAASVLVGQGCRRVLVADEYDRVGGNHIDWSSGDYTFDIGSLIFQDDSPLVKHFPELLERYVAIEPTWARLNPQRAVTAYPISIRDDILAAGPVEVAHVLGSALYARLFQRRLANARDFARYWIGSRLLHRSGLEAYMERFYGLPADQVDIEFAKKRMLWISENASVTGLLSRLKPRTAGPPNRQLARPREGFTHLYDAAVRRLEENGVVFALGRRFDRVERSLEGTFRLATSDGDHLADRVISTIPINRCLTLCGFDVVADLEGMSLLALYCSFSGKRGFRESILYNFSHQGAWKRLTVYSDFYGRVDDSEYFTAEVIAKQVDGSSRTALGDLRSHATSNGLFEGDLRLEGSQMLTNAYPVYRNGAEQKAAAAVDRLRTFGVESFGRQGAFNYQPTARVSTQEAEAALRPKVSDRAARNSWGEGRAGLTA